MTVLKKLPSADAECVIERLTSWARLQLQDKDHMSDEVGKGNMSCCLLKSSFFGSNFSPIGGTCCIIG